MGKQTVAQPYANILFINKKEHFTDTHNSMDEPQTLYARLNETTFRVRNYRDRNQVSGEQGLGLWREMSTKRHFVGNFGSEEIAPHFDYGGVTRLHTFVKTQKLYTEMGKIYRV